MFGLQMLGTGAIFWNIFEILTNQINSLLT